MNTAPRSGQTVVLGTHGTAAVSALAPKMQTAGVRECGSIPIRSMAYEDTGTKKAQARFDISPAANLTT